MARVKKGSKETGKIGSKKIKENRKKKTNKEIKKRFK